MAWFRLQMNAGIYNRATLVLLPRFSPDAALRLMEQEDVTIFAGVPTMYWALLNYPGADSYDLRKIARNLRVPVSGGAALPVEVMRAFNEKFQVTTSDVTAVFPHCKCQLCW